MVKGQYRPPLGLELRVPCGRAAYGTHRQLSVMDNPPSKHGAHGGSPTLRSKLLGSS